jgi:hypothetical protein
MRRRSGHASGARECAGNRPGREFRAAPLAAALACLALALLGGCGRRTTLARGGADSTVVSPDSMTVMARDAQSGWESGHPDDAARLTASFLLADLSQHPSEQWESRSRVLLDSLAVGAETAGAPCLVAANFFARSDPDAGSWPYLFWCGDKQPHMQDIEGHGMHLQSATLAPAFTPAAVPGTSITPGGQGSKWHIPYVLNWGAQPSPAPAATGAAPPGAKPGAPQPASVVLLFWHRAGGGQQPLVMSLGHARRDDPWNLVQTLGADSLGGVGTAEFVPGDTLVLVTRTYQPTRGFEECATCPHVFHTRRFRWRGNGFVKSEDQRVPSPYSSFVLFVTALSVDDRDAAAQFVTDPALIDRARKLDWGKLKGSWRAAPETDETGDHLVFFRGRDEAYRVDFMSQFGEWKIMGFEATSRSIE